jgi:hypothetical protein
MRTNIFLIGFLLDESSPPAAGWAMWRTGARPG